MVQDITVEDEGMQRLAVQGLKEIKKSRRTVILGGNVPLSTHEGVVIAPLTPPLSERASNDIEELYSPEREERYESIALSSSEDGEWDPHPEQQLTPTDESEDVCFL